MERFPVKIGFSRRTVVSNVLFTFIAIFLGYGIIAVSSKTVYTEDDTLLPPIYKAVFVGLFIIAELGFLSMVTSIWIRVFKKDGVMTLTEAGIENTFTILTVGAFYTLLPVHFIPWTALKVDGLSENRYTVDIERLPQGSVGRISKFGLKIGGFNLRMCDITKEEFEHFRHIALSHAEDMTE